jgi:cobaltochelatase CobN
MHLLAAQSGTIDDGEAAVDLGQTPGDIVVLSAADTELALLAAARAGVGDAGFPSVRLASLLKLGHNLSVDLYVEKVVAKARLAVVRLLGGRAYWPYGVEQVAAAGRENGVRVAFLPGDAQPDPELVRLSTLPAEAQHRLWQYAVEGGPENAANFLRYAAHLIGFAADWREPAPLPPAGLYWPGRERPDLEAVRAEWRAGSPVAALVFYRALVQAANVKAIDSLVLGLQAAGLNPLPLFATSLKEPVAAALVESVLARAPPDVVLNATGFAVSVPGGTRRRTALEVSDAPVLQAILAGGAEAAWRRGTRGLSPRDIAMNVALPEVDGRIVGRAVSFKGVARRDPLTEAEITLYEPAADRVAFVAKLAANWASLRRCPPAERRVAFVLANYPNRDGRLGNGVGLDTPAATVKVLAALAEAGYGVRDVPADGDALIRRLASGPTNDLRSLGGKEVRETLPLSAYRRFLDGVSEGARRRIEERWGAPESDPFFRASDGAFVVPAFRLGHAAVGLQPARGYNVDPARSYHDPDLPPPHAYLAFYAWIEREFQAHAVVHMGKHGNLEWLPGKALALSRDCFPEAAFAPLPHLYPFIVNDPGEGTQAKRRTQAVIVDHLTPPLTRAESYGPLRDLERLVDEYYEAAQVDPRRLRVLQDDILSLCRSCGLDADAGIAGGDGGDEALRKLDRYLCELKEMQIRDGLHVFGESPSGRLLDELLVALVRVQRGEGAGGDASILRALAADLGLGFDPLAGDAAAPWTGPRPPELADGTPWRTAGDTVERLEALALDLVAGARPCAKAWAATGAVLASLRERIRPAVEAAGAAELKGLLAGLAGRFVEPGPSGAPTRGRPDVLPTGRNFYSVDTRVVPTPAAWTLGWKSAALLVETHMQRHGEWPRAVALSAWGTSAMRTGGDDVAQALALVGARPVWDAASRRVGGFEVLPASLLGRPRVDVTLRVSGFFRDAFPGLIDLFDSAVRRIAALDEPAEQNPIAERVRAEAALLAAAGVAEPEAERRASFRVFGSKPGSYGAGLQALIDERGWETDADLARAYVAWGGYAYGGGAGGRPARGLFEARLKRVEAVVQNQDNREHDLLDSDDYYQFEGGLAAAVRTLSGSQPALYHADHSRPENPRVRTLEDEIGRVVRARAVNPKWIAGVMRHGYKGAFEMAATVDYLFAFAATARCVADHHFDAVYQAYLGDPEVRAFIAEKNPEALKEMSERLLEAQARGLWRTRLNEAEAALRELAGGGPGRAHASAPP